jgi:hypothetical protein
MFEETPVGGAEGLNPDLGCDSRLSQLELQPSEAPLSHNRAKMGNCSRAAEPERQANIAFMLIFPGIVRRRPHHLALFYTQF